MKLIGFVLGLCSILVVSIQSAHLLLGSEQWTSADFLVVSITFSLLSTVCFAIDRGFNK